MGIKYYKDAISNFKTEDFSGVKSLAQLKIDFNCPNLQDITAQREAEIAASAAQTAIDKAASEANEVAKQTSIQTNLPSWQAVSDAIDNAATLAAMKIIVKKLARVTYWIAKNTEL